MIKSSADVIKDPHSVDKNIVSEIWNSIVEPDQSILCVMCGIIDKYPFVK